MGSGIRVHTPCKFPGVLVGGESLTFVSQPASHVNYWLESGPRQLGVVGCGMHLVDASQLLGALLAGSGGAWALSLAHRTGMCAAGRKHLLTVDQCCSLLCTSTPPMLICMPAGLPVWSLALVREGHHLAG